MAQTERRTIGIALHPHYNSLNFLRLVLALIVVVDHAEALGGFGNNGNINLTPPGTMAVYGFFGISGYLIAGSARRNGTGRYLWQRFLRIFPAFWICLIITAFVFGAVGWSVLPHPDCGVGCFVSMSHGPLGYIWRNALLLINQQYVTPGGIENGSLWTLVYEFLCYLILMGLAAAGILRYRYQTAILAALAWGLLVSVTLSPFNRDFSLTHYFFELNVLRFVPVFLVGSVIYLYQDKVPDAWWLAVASGALFFASLLLPTDGHLPIYTLTSSTLGVPFIVYPVLWLGAHLPFQRVGAKNDYSYGIYIYAFPITQVLAVWGVYRWGYLLYALSAVLATVPFAAASWWFIEKPALAMKKLRWSGRRVIRAKRIAEIPPALSLEVTENPGSS